MPSRFPAGRCGTQRFCDITGLSRTIFLTRYRPDPHYIEQFDIRVDALNRLNMSERAARAFGEERQGLRPKKAMRVQRVPDVSCERCTASMPVRARFCPACGCLRASVTK